MVKKYFISYTTQTDQDIQWAKWVEWVLRIELRNETRMQEYDSKLGCNFRSFMDDALKWADVVVLILTNTYIESENCREEWTNAKELAPLRFDNCKPKGLLGKRAYIDLCGLEESIAMEKLINGLSNKIRPGKSETPYFIRCENELEHILTNFPVNNLPFIKNPYFTGRNNTIDKIHAMFQNGEYVSLTQTIKGLGGIGKTQIALEYAFRFSHEYNIIWWVLSESSQTLLNSFASFAIRMSLVNQQTTDEQTIKNAVISWLDNNQNWLFIFDNADNFDILREFFPRNNRGNILITTRFAHGNLGKSIDITVFKIDEAVAFLTKRTAINDYDNALLLVDRLGRLPLALEQAAAYILENDIQYQDYLQLLTEYGLATLDQLGQYSDYKIPVTATWKISIEKIKTDSAMQLLNLCSYWATDNINLEIFIKNNENLPNPLRNEITNKLIQNKLISELTRYSLINFKNGRISIHRLLQEVIRDSLINDYSWIECNLMLILNGVGFKYGNINSHLSFLEIAPHALSVLDQARNLLNEKERQVTYALLYRHIALSFQQLGIYTDNVKLFEKAITIQETIFGEKHIETSFSYQGLAGFYCEFGEYKKSEEYFLKAIPVLEKNLSDKDLSLGIIYINMGWLNYKQHKYQSAIDYYSRAKIIIEDNSGKEHPDTASVLNHIGLVYLDTYDYKKALDFFNKALMIREKLLGENHPDTGISYNNIGLTYNDLHEFETSIIWHLKALVLREKLFGENHPQTATSYHNISDVYINLEDYDKALCYAIKALNIRKSIYGELHPDTADSMFFLAKTYFLLEDYSNAISYFLKLREIDVQLFGEINLYIVNVDRYLGVIYQNQQDNGKAMEHYCKALNCISKLAGFDNKIVDELNERISSINNLVDLSFLDHDDNYKEVMHQIKYEQQIDMILTNAEKNIMETFSIFPAKNIPIEICENLMLQDAQKEDEQVTNQCFDNLYKKGLIEKNSTCYSINPVLSKIVYNKYHPTAIKHSCLPELLLYEQQTIISGDLDYQTAELFIDIISSLLDKIQIEEEKYQQLTLMKSNFYLYLGEFQKAIDVLHICKKSKDKQINAAYINTLGLINIALHKFDEAIKILKNGLNAPDEAQSGILNNIGRAYHLKMDYREALKWFLKSLKYKKDNAFLCTTYDNIGQCYNFLENYNEALSYFQKAIDICLELYGEESYLLAITYGNLSSMYRIKKDYEEALRWHDKAIIIIEKNGFVKPNDAVFCSNSSILFHEIGDIEKTVYWLKKAIDVCQKFVDETDEELQTYYFFLADYYSEMKEFVQAIIYFKKGRKLTKEFMFKNEDNLDSANDLDMCDHISMYYLIVQQYEKALGWLFYAIEIFEKYALNYNIEILYMGICVVYINMQQFDEATQYLQKIIDMKLPNIAIPYHYIGKAYRENSKIELAIKYLKRAINHYEVEKNNENMSINNIEVYFDIAEAFMIAKEDESAIDYYFKFYIRSSDHVYFKDKKEDAKKRLLEIYKKTMGKTTFDEWFNHQLISRLLD